MFRHNLILSLRNLSRYKLYSITNVLGLAMGLLSFMSIFIYNQYQEGFDRFHSRADHIYRLWDLFNSSERKSAMMPYKWTHHLADEFPEIERATAVQFTNAIIRRKNEVINESAVAVVDTSFLKVFDFQVLLGKQQDLLYSPNRVILEEATAIKYFGSAAAALDRDMEIALSGEFFTFRVEAIVSCPVNSHIQFDILLPFEPMMKVNVNPRAYESFSTHFVYSYVVIPSEFDHDVLQKKFKDFLFRHGGERLRDRYTTSLQPLQQVYLNSDQEFDFGPRGSQKNVTILWVVGWLVLIIASVNFVNLATAQSMKKIKEIGLRKVFGSGRMKIISQLLTDTLLLSTVAAFIAVIGLAVALPFFNAITGLNFTVWEVFTFQNMFVVALLAMTIGLLGGLYPALVMSSHGILQSLFTYDHPKSMGSVTRKGLIVIQFGISIFLLIATMVISAQVSFMMTKNLGIKSEQVLSIKDQPAVANDREKILLLRNELDFDGVEAVTSVSTYPGVPSWSIGFLPEGHDVGVSYSCIFTDHQFVRTYGINIVQGRDFDMAIPSDSVGFLINEKARDLFATYDSSWSRNPIGKNIKSNYLKVDGPVIGVMEDFHFESVHSEILPLIVLIYDRFKYATQIRLKTRNLPATLDKIETIWRRQNPTIPFEYQFLDSVFDESFGSDQQLSRLFEVFSVISILLTMIGLFGLTSFLIKEKLRNSSIKKVLGASVYQISSDLVRPIMTLLIIAMLMALPLGYYLMNQWLVAFPYRIAFPALVMVLAVFIVAIITLLATGYHVIKLVRQQPASILNGD